MPHHYSPKNRIPRRRRLILASGSPRRRQLIKAIDMPIRITGSGDNEPEPNQDESPQMYVQRLALHKARYAFALTKDDIVLGADTSVTIDGDILGKPKDAAHAVQMLERLRGRRHGVITGIALMDAATGICSTSFRISLVYMRDYSDDEIAAYVESGEPFDKAGAYAIQDEKFRPAESIDGCYLNIVGLPVCEVLVLLARIGAPATLRRGWTVPPGCPVCDTWGESTEKLQGVRRL